MKKLILLFFALLAIGTIFQACNNSKTYAEQQEEERNAIKKYLNDNNIKVISQDEFEKDTITNVAENEYVLFSNGVYMQIISRGTGDSIRNRDEILVRFSEYDIMDGYETGASNLEMSNYVDAFYYTVSNNSVYGQLIEEESWLIRYYVDYVYFSSFSTAVPTGWLVPLRYVTDRAHVKLIVPHKAGHAYSQRYVMPYFYEIHKYQVR